MSDRLALLDEFFRRYETAFNLGLEDTESASADITSFFTTCFIGANPSGVVCGPNDEKFRESVKQGYQYYKQIGIHQMAITSLEWTLLDELHALAKVKWNCIYTTKEQVAGNIEFINIYLVQTIDNTSRVFAYITGDEQATLKKLGLI